MEDFYALLAISKSADEETVRSAINRELRVWTQRTNAPEIDKRQAAERKVKLLEEAEAILLDPSKRTKYNGELDRQPIPTKESAAAQVPNESVQVLVEKAVGLLRMGQHPAAISLLTRAARLDPGNAKIQAMLAETKKEWGQILIKQNY